MLKEKTFIFRSIPYGKANRFEEPEQINFSEPLFLADHYTCSCPELLTVIAQDQYLQPRFYLPQDEDCLNVTVWTPSIDRNAGLPVIVWLGNGDWESGGANELFASDGEELSVYGNVVIVSVNHRTNILGTAVVDASGQLTTGENTPALADIELAFRWVRDNIGAFGGNPKAVTLWAHGKAEKKLRLLLDSHRLDGLYSKIILTGAVYGGVNMDQKLFTRLLNERLAKSSPKDLPYTFLAEAVLDAKCRYAEITGHQYDFTPTYAESDPYSLNCDRNTPVFVGAPVQRSAYVQRLTEHEKAQGKRFFGYDFHFSPAIYTGRQENNCSELAFFFHNAAYFESSYVPTLTESVQDEMASCIALFALKGTPWSTERRGKESITHFGDICAS